MPLDPAYNKAIEDIGNVNPFRTANRAGVSFDGREFRVPFFNRIFVIGWPDIAFSEVGTDRPVSLWLQIIVLHYLLTANGTSLADEWISFRDLPGGYIYEKAFVERAVQPLEQVFGSNLAGFLSAGEALGGVKMDRTGDAAFWFLAFPRLRMACILYLADEEMPASVNIVFDRAASGYLPTEDLSAVGGYLSGALIRS